eukprot:Hpha_TRINITY_DN19918_c0_g1::TRINITY_DN19918_c0_g1_i1::g.93527::m.93527
MPNTSTPSTPKAVTRRLSSAGSAKRRRCTDGDAPEPREGLLMFANIDPACAGPGAQAGGVVPVEVEPQARGSDLHTELRRSGAVAPTTPLEVLFQGTRVTMCETLADQEMSAEAR